MVEQTVPERVVHANGFTTDRWLDFDGAGDLRVELIDGALVVNPSPGFRHQRIVYRLLLTVAEPLALAGLTPEVTGGGVIMPGMEPAQGLIPDLMVARAGINADKRRALDGADVVLAVEVLSPSSRRTDRVTKLDLYARMGIPHYWLVDPEGPVTISTFVLDGQSYREDLSATGDETLSVTDPFEVALTPSALASRQRSDEA